MFESLSQRLQDTFDRLGRRGKLTDADVQTAMREVRLALLEADVALPVVKDFIKRVRDRAVGADVSRALKPGQQIVRIVHEELIETLGNPGRHSPSPYRYRRLGGDRAVRRYHPADLPAV